MLPGNCDSDWQPEMATCHTGLAFQQASQPLHAIRWLQLTDHHTDELTNDIILARFLLFHLPTVQINAAREVKTDDERQIAVDETSSSNCPECTLYLVLSLWRSPHLRWRKAMRDEWWQENAKLQEKSEWSSHCNLHDDLLMTAVDVITTNQLSDAAAVTQHLGKYAPLSLTSMWWPRGYHVEDRTLAEATITGGVIVIEEPLLGKTVH